MTDTPLCVAEPEAIAAVLNKAADTLEVPGVWNCEHCAATAIRWAADGNQLDTAAERYFIKHIGATDRFGIYDWNDASERTMPEVVAKLREAANVARAGDA